MCWPSVGRRGGEEGRRGGGRRGGGRRGGGRRGGERGEVDVTAQTCEQLACGEGEGRGRGGEREVDKVEGEYMYLTLMNIMQMI